MGKDARKRVKTVSRAHAPFTECPETGQRRGPNPFPLFFVRKSLPKPWKLRQKNDIVITKGKRSSSLQKEELDVRCQGNTNRTELYSILLRLRREIVICFCMKEKRSESGTDSGCRFRSDDLKVMSLARFPCAMSLTQQLKYGHYICVPQHLPLSLRDLFWPSLFSLRTYTYSRFPLAYSDAIGEEDGWQLHIQARCKKRAKGRR